MEQSDLLELKENVTRLQLRLDRLEKAFGLDEPEFISEALSSSARAYANKTASATPSTAQPIHSREVSRNQKSSNSSASFLGVVAVICFVLGAALLIRLAIDSGWLTPDRQWGMVTVLGLALLALGLRLRSADNEYAGLSAGAAVIVLYFAAYSGSRVFEILTAPTSFAMAGGVAFLSLWLVRRFRHDFFAVTATLGAYSTPLILSYGIADSQFMTGYFLIWSIVFSWISSELDSRVTALLAAYCGIGLFSILNLYVRSPEIVTLIAAVQALQFIIFCVGIARFSIRHGRGLTETEAWAYAPILLLFYGTEYHSISRLNATIAPWMSLGFAMTLLLCFERAKKRIASGAAALQSRTIVHAFVAIVLFHAAYLNLLPEDLKPFLLLLVILLLIMRPQLRKSSIENPIAVALLTLIGSIEFGRICLDLLKVGSVTSLCIGGAAAAMLLIFHSRANQMTDEKERESATMLPLVLATHLISVLSLYRLFQAFGSLAVSGSWMGYALLVLGMAFRRNDWAFARSSLLVFLLAAGKALIYDASQTPSGVRVICLLSTGVVLYGAGYVFKVIQRQELARGERIETRGR